jgi:hypothetical protein
MIWTVETTQSNAPDLGRQLYLFDLTPENSAPWHGSHLDDTESRTSSYVSRVLNSLADTGTRNRCIDRSILQQDKALAPQSIDIHRSRRWSSGTIVSLAISMTCIRSQSGVLKYSILPLKTSRDFIRKPKTKNLLDNIFLWKTNQEERSISHIIQRHVRRWRIRIWIYWDSWVSSISHFYGLKSQFLSICWPSYHF